MIWSKPLLVVYVVGFISVLICLYFSIRFLYQAAHPKKIEPIKIDPVREKALIAARQELDEIDRIFYDRADEVALIHSKYGYHWSEVTHSTDKIPGKIILPENHHFEPISSNRMYPYIYISTERGFK